MKRLNRALLCLLAAFLIQFPVAARGDQSKPETAQPEKVEWKTEVSETGTLYQFKGCSIFVSKDGEEVYVYASEDPFEFGSRRNMRHLIYIKDKTLDQSWDVTDSHGGTKFLFEGPPIFARYTQAVKELPDSARKAFQGFFDIK